MFPNYPLLTIIIVSLVLVTTSTRFSMPSVFTSEVNAKTTTKQQTNPIFQPILAELKAKTQIPIRLPQDIPDSGDSPVYVSLKTAIPDRYLIELAFARDCYGATACRLGELSGEKKTRQSAILKGQKVTLTKGITGYFTPSLCGANCSDVTLIWEQDGARYTVSFKAGKIENLKRVANSAIASSPLTRDRVSIPANQTISANGIGSAQLGMKYGQLKHMLGKNTEFLPKKDFRVDFDAIAIRQSGQVKYYILHRSGEKFQDSNIIEVLMTDNPNYRTLEGVSPGISLTQAEKIYGQAILSYNTSNESREYVRFAKYSAKNIYFLLEGKTAGKVGIYSPSTLEYQETTQFREGAIIRFIEVVLVRQN